LTPEELDIVKHGRRIAGTPGLGNMARAISPEGDLISLLEFDYETSEWQPKKVFSN